MMTEDNFRSRSQSVRQNARAHLQDIRRARLAKRGGLALPENVVAESPSVGSASVGSASVGSASVGSASVGFDGEVAVVEAPLDAPPGPDLSDVPGSAAQAAHQMALPEPTPQPAPEAATIFIAAASAKAPDTVDDLENIAVKNAAMADLAEVDLPRPQPRILTETPSAKKGSKSPGSVRKPAAKRSKVAPALSEAEETAVKTAALAAMAEVDASAETVPDTPAVEAMRGPVQPEPALAGTPPEEPAPQDLASADLAPQDMASADPTPTAQDVQATPIPVAAKGQSTPQSGQAILVQVSEGQGGSLQDLPGAGPGLIWMLNQCGITSIQDLAASNAEELTPKLGLVGQILNIQTWLDFARAQSAAR